MIQVGIVGVTGYAGVELLRLLLNHPEVEVKAIVSHSFSDKEISDIYSSMKNICSLTCLSLEDFLNKDIDGCDVVFAALPHGLSEEIAYACDARNKVFIDLGADFRLTEEQDYKTWYGLCYKYSELHKKAQYGLPELYRDSIKKSKLIGNPGCYPTSVILALAPALRNKLIQRDSIIIDSKSGLTGAGRELSASSHYAECNESMSAYKIGSHRHTPEIEQELSAALGEKIIVSFTPHLLPVNRGILSTIYAKAIGPVDINKLIELYREFYKESKFVRIMEKGKATEIKNIRGSNYCDISINYDDRTGRIIIVSAIDNMIKGAAGQAIQNMNIIFELNEDTGLKYIPAVF
jgi:N-acetyl-gamma-glutamyl-phosphate reductase